MLDSTEVTTDGKVGVFHCPICAAERNYKQRRVRRYVTVMGIRVVPREVLDEHLICMKCESGFPLELLSSAHARPGSREAAHLRATRLVMASAVAADGVVEAVEIATVQRVYRDLVGAEVDLRTLENEAESCRRKKKDPIAEVAKLKRMLNASGRRFVVRAAVQVGISDGRLDASEQDLAYRIGQALDVPSSEIKLLIREEVRHFMAP